MNRTSSNTFLRFGLDPDFRRAIADRYLIDTELGQGGMGVFSFGVQPNDVGTFAGVTLVMAVIGIGACWIPARRAARIDPLVAMRAE